MMIGAPLNSEAGEYAGETYLLLGVNLGAPGSVSLAQADFSFVGENNRDHAGISVSTAGDVDGDGLDDLMVGAFHNSEGGTYSGKTYLLMGGK